jgi:hypothetical protein
LWRVSITKSEAGKNSKNSQIFIFGFEWVAKDRKGWLNFVLNIWFIVRFG